MRVEFRDKINGGIVVTSRLDSSRFPNKSLKLLLDLPVLSWCLTRLSTLDIPVILATTNRLIDNPLVPLCQGLNVPIFRGETNDLLKRLFDVLVFYDWDWLVRISGDSPAIDPNIVLKSLKILEEQNYSSNEKTSYIISNLFPIRSYPAGQSVELISRSSLSLLLSLTEGLTYHREHVTTYAYENSDLFSIIDFSPEIPTLENISFTVDSPEDLKKLSAIAASLNSPMTASVEEWIDAHLIYNLKPRQN